MHALREGGLKQAVGEEENDSFADSKVLSGQQQHLLRTTAGPTGSGVLMALHDSTLTFGNP